MGKSASGKDTLLNELKKDGFETIVSTTTRPMREGETNGVEYNFVSKEEFNKNLNNFLEYRSYNTLVNGKSDTWYYGSPKVNPNEKDYIVILDVEGAKDYLLEYGKDNVFVVYLDCPDDIRTQRAVERGSFNEAEWNRRLEDDIIKFAGADTIADIVLDATLSIESLKDYVKDDLGLKKWEVLSEPEIEIPEK